MNRFKENGLDASEAGDEYFRAVEEHHKALLEEYENDPLVNAGWAQQDVIDMYRRER